MTLSDVLQFVIDNIIFVVLGLIVLFLVLKRLNKSAKMYLRMKKYVKQTKKLNQRRFNGLTLVDKIKRKRKRHTNDFRHLRRRPKREVRKYLAHKMEEIPVLTRYSYGKLFKRSKNKAMFYLKLGKRNKSKWTAKHGVKHWIELSDEYACIDEMIVFLHHLPEAILDKRDYEMHIEATDITITYQIK